MAVVLTSASCTDFLDQPRRGVENLDTYFQNQEQCESFLIGCYGALFYDDWWYIGKLYQALDMCTDDAWMGNTGQDASSHRPLAHFQASAPQSDDINDFYRYRYKGITRCNIAIERIAEAPIDATVKARMVAEAKFLRAFFYFELIKNYGGVVKVTGFLTPSETEGAVRSSIAESYALVEQDLLEAIPDLPLRSELAASEVGRATSVPGMDDAVLREYLPDGKMVINPANNKSGRAWRKFFIPYDKRPATWDKGKIPQSYRLLRYADVLLMYAEACVESNADLDKGQDAFDRVRRRVGLATKPLTRANVRLERRLELAGEQQRLYDIRRWDSELKPGHKVMAELFGPDGTFVKYNTEQSTDEFETTNLKEDQNKGITFDESRDLLFPIPPMEIALSNGSIQQNPGYSQM